MMMMMMMMMIRQKLQHSYSETNRVFRWYQPTELSLLATTASSEAARTTLTAATTCCALPYKETVAKNMHAEPMARDQSANSRQGLLFHILE
jgi:hypothetical protein